MWESYDISDEIYKKIKKKAEKVSELRRKCKLFLTKNNLDFDKFTIVEHDSEIGYIAEKFVQNYLVENTDLKLRHWSDHFDLKKISDILDTDNPKDDEINLIKDFFYDRYDIELDDGNKKLYIDVKTAKTKRIPKLDWNFLYPLIQTKEKVKDENCIVLTYLIFDDRDCLKKIFLIGAMNYTEITNSKIQPKNTLTIKMTKSQTDNYITELPKYKNLMEYINLYFANI